MSSGPPQNRTELLQITPGITPEKILKKIPLWTVPSVTHPRLLARFHVCRLIRALEISDTQTAANVLLLNQELLKCAADFGMQCFSKNERRVISLAQAYMALKAMNEIAA